MCLYKTPLLFFLTATLLQAQVAFTSSNLPIVLIDTYGQNIPYDNPRIIAGMRMIDNGPGKRNSVTDAANAFDGRISLEIHGQSSAGWDKKSYALETQQENGENLNVSLLGLPEENDWILHGPYFDRSLLRNVLIYQLARQMGHYASRTRFCELVINGEYKGFYILMEKIKRDKNRVNIANLEADENSGDDLTGGYIVRVDKEGWKPGFDSPYPPFPGSQIRLRYQYVYPKADEITEAQAAYISDYVLAFERHMYQNSFADSLSYYLDVDAAVDYFILNEISRNVDGYRLSAYLYKDKNSKGGKLVPGPVWDYNFSFGNVGYDDSWLIEGWQLLYFAENTEFHQTDSFLMPFWWKKLFNQRLFVEKLQKRWVELRAALLDMNHINSMLEAWADSTEEARQRNFTLWPGPGNNDLGAGWFPPLPPQYQPQNYDQELNYLKSWLDERMRWMDTALPQLTDINAPRLVPTGEFQLTAVYPNPFNPSTTIRIFVPQTGTVTFTVYGLDGSRIGPSISRRCVQGENSLELDLSNQSSGSYLLVARYKHHFALQKLLLIK